MNAAQAEGREIRRYRRALGLTQAELAARIVEVSDGRVSCDRSTVSHWERGDWRPGLTTGGFIAEALGIPERVLWPPS